MKYLKSIFIAALFVSFNSHSQVNPHAIGVRLAGGHFGHYGGEISYQHGFGEKNRLELDLGFRSNPNARWQHAAFTAIFHWDWNIMAGWNWFVGPGAQIGWYDDRDWTDDDYLGIGVGGQIGMEYDFNHHDVPILVGVDVRPMWNLLGWYNGFGYGTALSARYTF